MAPRDSKTRETTWDEIDLGAAVWTLLAERTHARRTVTSNAKGRPVVVHGTQSTFWNWGRELATFRPELLELSLAHKVGNAAEEAYACGDSWSSGGR